MDITFGKSTCDVWVPDGTALVPALERTTHLGIGAHPDDLEFMAIHGILQCFGRADAWFTGVTWTNQSFPSANLTGLTPDLTYYYTFVASNAAGTVTATLPSNVMYFITGGVLAQYLGGQTARLEFRDVLGARCSIAAIHDFDPALPWFFYRFTQAIVHALVMKGFQRHMARLANTSPDN